MKEDSRCFISGQQLVDNSMICDNVIVIHLRGVFTNGQFRYTLRGKSFENSAFGARSVIMNRGVVVVTSLLKVVVGGVVADVCLKVLTRNAKGQDI